jgi:hypothetical protein
MRRDVGDRESPNWLCRYIACLALVKEWLRSSASDKLG